MSQQMRTDIACKLGALSVFRGIHSKKPISAFMEFLRSKGDTEELLSLYGEFVYSLAEDNYCFSDALKRVVFADENSYIVGAARGEAQPAVLAENVKAELGIFTELTKLDSASLTSDLDVSYIPCFANSPVDFSAEYSARVKDISRYGYGIFSSANMFNISGGDIIPVKTADDISISSFVGYEQERAQVFDNTAALIAGKPAANVLLFGDAGTGKSSTVKACANHFASEGLRLIELRKDQLFSLPHIMGRIANNPLKFIIFIDDLSFNKNDDCFSMLKAALEGSASAKAKNAVIYATSNRRHIVKETFSDRVTSDDIHHNDTVQELMSLSDRFGLTVYFEKPNKLLYLDIVHKLAEKKGISCDPAELDVQAEAYALRKGFRSPRAAEQFINSLI